jgi:uncharacterized flavoprotein (TIGR03862 family)
VTIPATPHSVAVIGGGPAGLMAAEVARAAGLAVDLYEAKGSVGRKFLLAGKGGFNLTHSESHDAFVSRFRGREAQVGKWLEQFDSTALRDWARGLGVDTVIGTSGRVFPTDFKAAPLLRRWVRHLREQGVHFHVNHRCTGWDASGALNFETPQGKKIVQADAVVLALGGGSWPELGSDGQWVGWLSQTGAEIAPLQPANCGFEVDWSEHFRNRHAGDPVKPVVMHWQQGAECGQQQGEMVITDHGIEGGLVYALSGLLREAIAAKGTTTVHLDLAPGRDESRLATELAQPRGKRSVSEHLRRHAGIDGVKAGLLYEVVPKAEMTDASKLAHWIKQLPLVLKQARPLAEAISTAGGVCFDATNEQLMLGAKPGVFCAGEMLDWEAPTGGYLLTACMASGRVAGQGAVDWLGGN